jgi:hypothetical protein
VEHGLRGFENGVLWRIFRAKREEVTGGWGKKYATWSLRNLYSSPNNIRVMKSKRAKMDGIVVRMWK